VRRLQHPAFLIQSSADERPDALVLPGGVTAASRPAETRNLSAARWLHAALRSDALHV
jgi:hypothetical protein